MNPPRNFAQIPRMLHEICGAGRHKVAVIVTMASLTIICAGYAPKDHRQGDSGPAGMQGEADAAQAKVSPKSKSALHGQAGVSSRPADDKTGDSAHESNSFQSSVAINSWRYCLAPSQAQHMVYITPPFAPGATTDIAFAKMLRQVQHDDMQCPIADSEASILIMRRHALSFNRNAGNIIVTWEPPKFFGPASKNIVTGKKGPSREPSAWQYCLASSHREKKIYISSPFARAESLTASKTAFVKMLFRSNIKHIDVQCPMGKDEPSILSMRNNAISFNQNRGNVIITLNWKP
jgi:hypothetical protein